MSRSKPPPKPYYAVAHDYADSLKAYTDAALMLYNAIDTSIKLAESNPASASRLLLNLRTHADAFHDATTFTKRLMMNLDAEITAALARCVQRINERLAAHVAKPLSHYRRSIAQRLRRAQERERGAK